MTKALAIGYMTFIVCSLFPQQEEKGGGRRFIVGFELSTQKGRTVIWPPRTMPPSGYKSVLMVVETMPRVFRKDGGGESWIYLSAHRHLRENGRTLPAGKNSMSEVPGFPQEFILGLPEGRLRISLDIPSGWRIDPQHDAAVVKLFEVERRSPAQLWLKRSENVPHGATRRLAGKDRPAIWFSQLEDDLQSSR